MRVFTRSNSFAVYGQLFAVEKRDHSISNRRRAYGGKIGLWEAISIPPGSVWGIYWERQDENEEDIREMRRKTATKKGERGQGR